MANMEKAVKLYISLRDQKEKIMEEAKEACAPLQGKMDFIEAAIQKWLLDNKLKNLKTEAGTAYLSDVKSVKIEDWSTALSFIKEKEAWELLTRSVNKTALMDEFGGEIPGVQVNTITKTNFRRS